MTKPLEAPSSWRDLSHAELVSLLEDRPMLYHRRDLVWAQWRVASAARLAALEAEGAAFKAEMAAFDAWRAKSGGKTLTAWEDAQAKARRARATLERLRRRAQALYDLHDRLRSEAGA